MILHFHNRQDRCNKIKTEQRSRENEEKDVYKIIKKNNIHQSNNY